MVKKKETVSERCQYFKHLGTYGRNYVCYGGSWLKIILFGAEIVKFDDWCNRFEYAKKYQIQNIR